MKKTSPPWRLVLCISLLVALFLSGCAKEPEYAQRACLTVKEEVTTTSEFLVLDLENHTDRTVDILITYPHQLQKREETGWVDIPLTEYGKNAVALENKRLGPTSGETRTFYIPVVKYYGNFLPIGEYRLFFTYKLYNANLTQTIDDAWYFLILK